jgi:uncharacterized protein (TIGR03089 family)
VDAYTLLQTALATDPGRPLLTMYDDQPAPGSERIELSVATFGNWIAKTANYLLDELMLEPGEPVGVMLPAHWQTAVMQVAVLAAGGHVTAAPARITCWADGTDLPDDPVVEEIVGFALRPMGLGFTPAQPAPPGVLDYSVDVRGHGDRFSPRYPQADLELEPLGERVLTDRLDPLLAALAGGGSLVLCRRPDPAALPHRAEVERVTATLGLDVDGIPRLAG